MPVTPSNGGQAATHNSQTSHNWLVIFLLFQAQLLLLNAFFLVAVIPSLFGVLVSNLTPSEH